MYPGKRTDHRFGLLIRATAKDVALHRRVDVFEHQNTVTRLPVTRAAEAVGDAAAHILTRFASEQQLAFDLRGAVLLDNE